MKQKKLTYAMIGLSLVLFFVLGGCYLWTSTSFNLTLPQSSELSSITLTQDTYVKQLDTSEEIEQILTILQDDGRSTHNESYHDAPLTSSSLIKIDFHHTQQSRLYVYKKDNKYYLEEPYGGIYVLPFDDFNEIERYIR